MEWQQIRLFISSTFRDMYYEREFLVKNVLPELKNGCLERRLILNEIDLRWGVTESMARTRRLTVYKYLRGVDASGPFFLSFWGNIAAGCRSARTSSRRRWRTIRRSPR